MMKLLTKTTALFLWIPIALVLSSSALAAEDPDGERTLNFGMYCETEVAMRTLMGHLATGGMKAANKFYMAKSTPCYSIPRRVNATVVRVVTRVPLPRGAEATILEVRVQDKAKSVVYVFMVTQKPASNDTRGRALPPGYWEDQRDV